MKTSLKNLAIQLIVLITWYTILTRLREKQQNKPRGETKMSEFWKVAYSTENRTICYDTTDFDCSSIYEYKDSYAEHLQENSFNFDGYDY